MRARQITKILCQEMREKKRIAHVPFFPNAGAVSSNRSIAFPTCCV
jgi:hypothetical protein